MTHAKTALLQDIADNLEAEVEAGPEYLHIRILRALVAVTTDE